MKTPSRTSNRSAIGGATDGTTDCATGWEPPQRRTPRASDDALTGTARQWLRQLPSRRRPLRLCQLYPRVANRLAWSWHDAELAAQALEDLLQDRRGGRQGFPVPVERELRRLADFNAAKRVDPHGDGWWTSFGKLAGL